MRRYVSLPIKELVSNVAVDPVHVRELADSIKISGPISPVLVREEDSALIDGFHRVAAMKELGFQSVECILTPCDEETFWDLRIMSATLHKAVTFARAIDWIDQVFKTSPWKARYKSSYMLFSQARKGEAPEEIRTWAREKASKWGLALATIEEWLHASQTLAEDLLEKVKSPRLKPGVPLRHYVEVASELPGRFDLQRGVIQKAEQEELTLKQVEEVARAVKRAEDDEEVQSILRQPVSRTEDQMVREAKVEKILSQPREVAPVEEWQKEKAKDVLYKLDLWGIINSSKAMTLKAISALTAEQKADVYRTCEEAIAEIRRVMDMIRPTIEAEYLLKEG